MRRLLVGLALVVLGIGALAGVQLHRRQPAPLVMLDDQPAVRTVIARLPWPTTGQASVDVAGIGMASAQPDQPSIPIGSVAKVMTAYVILRSHPLQPGGSGPAILVTSQDELEYRTRARTIESLLPVHAGELLTERQALEASLVPSANNIADLLARWDAGSVNEFVDRLNNQARQLGLNRTHYDDASGVRTTTTSNADDQVRLAETALRNPVFADIVARRDVVLPGAGRLRNYNSLLDVPGVIGVKTGSTPAAGGNIVFAARAGSGPAVHTIVGAVLGQQVGRSPLKALGAALKSARTLLLASEAAIRPIRVVQGGNDVGQVTTRWGSSSKVYTANSLQLLAAPGSTSTTELEPLTLAVPEPAGTVVGTLTVRIGSQQTSTPLLIRTALRPPDLAWRLRRL